MTDIYRLLSKEEMRAINDAMPSDAKYGDVFKAIAIAQGDLTMSQLSEKSQQEHREAVEGMRDELAKIFPFIWQGSNEKLWDTFWNKYLSK